MAAQLPDLVLQVEHLHAALCAAACAGLGCVLLDVLRLGCIHAETCPMLVLLHLLLPACFHWQGAASPPAAHMLPLLPCHALQRDSEQRPHKISFKLRCGCCTGPGSPAASPWAGWLAVLAGFAQRAVLQGPLLDCWCNVPDPEAVLSQLRCCQPAWLRRPLEQTLHACSRLCLAAFVQRARP